MQSLEKRIAALESATIQDSDGVRVIFCREGERDEQTNAPDDWTGQTIVVEFVSAGEPKREPSSA